MSTAVSIDQITFTQSPLVGDSTTGRAFDDIADVFRNNGTADYNIDVGYSLTNVTVVCGGVIDGMSLVYKKTGSTDNTVTQYHGTTTNTAYVTDPTLEKVEVDLKDGDQIIAINGYHGQSYWGNRVTMLSFITCNSTTGEMTLHGPYGGGGGNPFNFTARGQFMAVSGTAINCNLTLGQLEERKLPGGLYGLIFCDVAYTAV